MNFLRSIHEGNELDLSLLEARDVSMNNKDESENVVADINDYETVVYDYANRGLEPTEVRMNPLPHPGAWDWYQLLNTASGLQFCQSGFSFRPFSTNI